MENVRIGILGLGAISGIYLKNLTGLFKETEVVGIYDLIPEKMEQAQKEYGIPKAYSSMEEMFQDKDIEIILNLTRPFEHYETTKAALLAGKHVYSEKPLAATFEEGKELVALAQEKGLLLGGAPDTFLGAAIQTCRKLIDDGFIGRPIGATAQMICHGHESWHPSPEFYYQYGGGPMMDMGPYYMTALVNLLGSAKGLTGLVTKSFETRTITSEPKCGTVVPVEVPTHVMVFSSLQTVQSLQLLPPLTYIMTDRTNWKSTVRKEPSVFPIPMGSAEALLSCVLKKEALKKSLWYLIIRITAADWVWLIWRRPFAAAAAAGRTAARLSMSWKS